MAPSRNRQTKRSREHKIPQSKQNEISPETDLSSNRDQEKDIFIAVEPETSTNLIVAENDLTKPEPKEQQVDVPNEHRKPEDAPNTIVEIEPKFTEMGTQEIQPISDESNIEGSGEFDFSSMSATVTKLTTPNGCEVFLVGTAHFSLQSVEDVRKVIRYNKPSSVIMELCKERAFMLSLDEQYLFEQNSKLSFQTIKETILQKGVIQGLIYVLFIKMSASLTEKNGMAPGAEFRAASIEAQKIPGCSVVLADRSLRTTIARAVKALNLWQKIKLIYQVLGSDLDITPADVEKCKERDILEQLMLELGSQFPGFKRVLLDERDVYLSHSIYNWAQCCETSLGPPKVVAVVGIGHMQGIVTNWGTTTDEQISALNIVPETSRTEIVVMKTIKYCTIAAVIYVGYCCLVPSSIQNNLSSKLFSR